MYLLIFALLIGSGVGLIRRSVTMARRPLLWAGVSLLLVSLILYCLMAFWFELMWFNSLDFTERFWTFFLDRIAIVGSGILIAGLLAYFLTRGRGRHLRKALAAMAAIVGCIWGLLAWERVLMFRYGVDTLTQEPLLGLDVGFYLFTLPLLDSLFPPALIITITCLLAVSLLRERDGLVEVNTHFLVPHSRLLVPGISLALAILLAYGQMLGVFHLLYSKLGVVMGPA